MNAKNQEDYGTWLSKLQDAIEALALSTATTKLKRHLKIEVGGHGGGKFGTWKDYHFVIRKQAGDDGVMRMRLVGFDNILTDKDPFFRSLTKNLHVRLPKTKRARQPWAFRIDTKKGRKLIVDAETQEDRDAWIIELGNHGAEVPKEFPITEAYHDHEHE